MKLKPNTTIYKLSNKVELKNNQNIHGTMDGSIQTTTTIKGNKMEIKLDEEKDDKPKASKGLKL